ncbi:3-ketoacyl-CoA thiolase [Rhodococcus wratislaviensis]|uniref:3-ketoacyl-CoA thiolase n=1 Tax=Rhodococcus wratislaviensis TaxID=44752 RepID=A0A402CLY5_RHOWR|nr:thiolase family protein [Rhodococcus wratislaviensis]GCE44555.1 3-ketoacyl-CoA thiolase [Rhodococcus wratislaviensis]
MKDHAVIAGVGITKATSPRRQTLSKSELCRSAADLAIEHAGIDRADIDTVIIGDIAGFEASSVQAKTLAPALGLTPLTNVVPISTGGTSGGHLPNQAATLIKAGFAERVLCIAPNTFDGPVDLQAVINTNSPMIMEQPLGMGASHMGAFFPAAYQERYSISDEDLMAVAAKNRADADFNPYAHVTSTLPDEQANRMISTPLRLGMTCPVSSGAIALVVTAESIAKAESSNPPVRITGHGSISDGYLGGKRRDFSKFEVVEIMARRAYRDAQILNPFDDFDVAELFNPLAPMEYMLMESFGLCEYGAAPELVKKGATSFGGALPVNLSGGIVCTNPGLAGQIAPVAHVALQLMGQSATRQVEGAKRGLAHSAGGTFFQFHTTTIMERVG